jgi:hypothetical protein
MSLAVPQCLAAPSRLCISGSLVLLRSLSFTLHELPSYVPFHVACENKEKLPGESDKVHKDNHDLS